MIRTYPVRDREAAASLAAALAALLTAAGLTGRHLADRAGLPAAAVRKAESASRWLPRPFWQACDDALKAGGTLLARYDSLTGTARLAGPAPHVPDITAATIAAEDAERNLVHILADRRKRARLDPDMLASLAFVSARDIRKAEAGRLVQPRRFFQSLDTALNLGGELLNAYDAYAAIVRLRTDDADPATSSSTTPPADTQDPARAPDAIVIIWNDGTRTAALCPARPRNQSKGRAIT